jgi:hypothetical protein
MLEGAGVQPAPFSFNESSLTSGGDRGKKEGRFLEEVGSGPADRKIRNLKNDSL